MSSVPLIDTRARNNTSSNPTLIVSHIGGPLHCVTTHHVNPPGSFKSFIDLSELLRLKYVGQAVLMHAARSSELPSGTVGSDWCFNGGSIQAVSVHFKYLVRFYLLEFLSQ